ncbi:histidine kinase [Actinoplanes sp. NBC_00393]|uniref:sensor histidine kinase n=1 Tax=Actinoplanes sp. NBC_00393 TaxID=2975953 RepID=UPI002E224F7C
MVDTITVTTCGVAFVYVQQSATPTAGKVLAAPLLVAVAVLHLWFTRSGRALGDRRVRAVLTAQAVLTVVPIVWYGPSWTAMPGLCMAALLVVGGWWAIPVTVVVIAASISTYAQLTGTLAPYPLLVSAVSAAVFLLQAYGLTRLGRLVGELRRTRRALAEVAVWAERTRLADDLRGLLPSSLTLVARKAETARRLVTDRPEAAGRELDEMVVIARRGLAGMRGLARDYRVDGPPPVLDEVPWRTVRFATWLLRAVVGLWFVAWVLSAVDRAGVSVAAAVAVGCGVVCAVLQLGYLSRVTPPSAPWSYVALGVQSGAVLVPLMVFGLWGLNPRGVLAGSCLLVLRPLPAVTCFGMIMVLDTVLRLRMSPDLGDAANGVAGTLIVGLATFGMTQNVRLTSRLRTLRHRLAREAAGQERVRIARDLHDLLGLGMSAIALKTEVAARLAKRDPQRARAELAEIVEVCRSARADVDNVAAGRRDLSWPDELRAAEATLTGAGLQVRVQAADEPPERVRALLAVVLREGVTNVLRHGAATHCEITLSGATLTIVNDLAATADPASPPGSGLTNLRERVARLGGELSAAPTGDGRFVLRIAV